MRIARSPRAICSARRGTLGALLVCGLLWLLISPAHAFTPTHQLRVDGVDIEVDADDAAFPAGVDPLLAWIRRGLHSVAAYYDGYPVRSLRIQIVPQDGGGVHGGKTFGYRGAFIRVRVGRDVTDAQLMNDWVLVHEMIHVALPEIGEEHAWLAEGLAVYVEGIAREQSGNRTQQDIFAEEMRSMPRGLPQAGDRGLDHTHSWGRTYWGGAMFCLLADVAIHRQTGNRRGLQDALRAVAKASGGITSEWPITRVLAVGDAVTGTTVLADLYAQMKDAPVTPDLHALWTSLGVREANGTVTLTDAAPLAAVREAIMRPRGSKTPSSPP